MIPINRLSKAWQARKKPKAIQQQQIEAIAYRLYLNRIRTGRVGNEQTDWERAVSVCNSPTRRLLYRVNQPLIKVEKGTVEPVANWLDRADLFRIVGRVSPAIEALGVLAIPFVLFFATQEFEKRQERQESERLQQQAVKDYLGQLSTLLLDVEGDLRDPQNAQLRTLTEATTLAFLDEPNLDGRRKGQVIDFLSQMELINSEAASSSLPQESKEPPALGLRNVNLSDANLLRADLSGASLSNANLSNADLSDADLSFTELIGAELNGANLSSANLSDANLSSVKLNGAFLNNADLNNAELGGANLSNANLNSANLSSANLTFAFLKGAFLNGVNLYGANLSGASLSGAGLRNADLSRADLSSAYGLIQEQLEPAFLCETKLPEGINLDSNRDCL